MRVLVLVGALLVMAGVLVTAEHTHGAKDLNVEVVSKPSGCTTFTKNGDAVRSLPPLYQSTTLHLPRTPSAASPITILPAMN